MVDEQTGGEERFYWIDAKRSDHPGTLSLTHIALRQVPEGHTVIDVEHGSILHGVTPEKKYGDYAEDVRRVWVDRQSMAAHPADRPGDAAVPVAWRPMSEEPIGRPITARMILQDGSWWYARVRVWRHEDGEGGRFGDHGYELLHYNGDVTMGRFYGPFHSWCEIGVAVAPTLPAPSGRVGEEDPRFTAIWECIKGWDIGIPAEYGGYCGATGSHVRKILATLDATLSGQTGGAVPAGDLRAGLEEAVEIAQERALEIWHRRRALPADLGPRSHEYLLVCAEQKIAEDLRDTLRARLAEQPGEGPVAPKVGSDQIEDAARKVYEGFSFLPGYVPWVDGGNSHKQNEARALVRAALDGASSGGATP